MNRNEYLLTTGTAVLTLLCMTGANTLSTITVPDQPNATLAVSTLPHVPTNAILKTHPIADYPNGIIRDDYATGTGAPQLLYLPNNAACSIASGAGDNGSQVQSSDNKCWLAHFPTGNLDARQFGADTTAVSSSTTAVQNCMNAAGAMRLCDVSGYSVLISGSVSLMANGGITCGRAFGDLADANTSSFGTVPSLILASGTSIQTGAGAESATVSNCVIRPAGMTFPAAHASPYLGTAIQDTAVGAGSLTVSNDVIVGFDSCIYTTNVRPVINRVYCDGEGITHAAIDIANGNTDSGHIDKVKIQPLGTGNYGNPSTTCSVVTRAGTGLHMGGINFIGQIVVQNYQVSQITINSPVLADILWSDFPYQCANAYPNSVGILINTGNPAAALWANQANVNATGIGLVAKTGVTHINFLFANVITGDCIQLGASGSSAYLKIDNYSTNNGNTTATFHNCGMNAGASGGTGYALNWMDNTTNSFIQINGGHINNVASTPYLNIPGTTITSQVAIGDHLTTDLTNPNTLYGTTTLGATSGLGAGGSVVMISNRLTTPWKGAIQATIGSAPSTSGSIVLNWPLTFLNEDSCRVTFNNGSFSPTPPVSTWMQSINTTSSAVFWALGGTPTVSGTMAFNFACDPQ